MALAAESPVRLLGRAPGRPRSGAPLEAVPPADGRGLPGTIGHPPDRWRTHGYRRLTASQRREAGQINEERVWWMVAQLAF